MLKEVEDGSFFENFHYVMTDKANISSFRGWSNCYCLYNMIKDKEAFSWALRIIKIWAKKRGIYGFNFGYLNGISLIIMLVKAHITHHKIEAKRTP